MIALQNILTLLAYIALCYAVWYGVEFMTNKKSLKEANGDNNDSGT